METNMNIYFYIRFDEDLKIDHTSSIQFQVHEYFHRLTRCSIQLLSTLLSTVWSWVQEYRRYHCTDIHNPTTIIPNNTLYKHTQPYHNNTLYRHTHPHHNNTWMHTLIDTLRWIFILLKGSLKYHKENIFILMITKSKLACVGDLTQRFHPVFITAPKAAWSANWLKILIQNSSSHH